MASKIRGDFLTTGSVTATGGFVGAVTGAITGNITGNVTGNLTGNVTGNVTGNITGNSSGTHTGSVVTASTNQLTLAGVNTADTAGGVIKCGTSAAPVTADVADMRFIQCYFDNGATSGDNRGIYAKLSLTGAGGSGETLRALTDVLNVAADTARGAHISLSFGTTGSITGLGVAMGATIHVPNALSSGTYAAIQAEIWGDGAASSVSGTTEYSFMRFSVSGSNANVVGTVDDSAFLFSIQGLTAETGHLFQVNTAGAATHALRIRVGSTPYYIMLTDTGA